MRKQKKVEEKLRVIDNLKQVNKINCENMTEYVHMNKALQSNLDKINTEIENFKNSEFFKEYKKLMKLIKGVKQRAKKYKEEFEMVDDVFTIKYTLSTKVETDYNVADVVNRKRANQINQNDELFDFLNNIELASYYKNTISNNEEQMQRLSKEINPNVEEIKTQCEKVKDYCNTHKIENKKVSQLVY